MGSTKSKNGSNVAAALSKIFHEDKRYPQTCRRIKERNFTTLPCKKNCEEIQHKSLFNVFDDESVGNGTI